MLRMALSLVMIFWVSWAGAEIREVTVDDDLRAAIAKLQPGDQLLLGGGTYGFSSQFKITAVGLLDRSIVIRAKDDEDVLIEMNTGAQNILEVADSRYLEIHNFRFRGGSHGIRLINSDFITTNGPTVEQGDGIELKEGSAGNVIRHNVIHDTNYPGIITYSTSGNGPANIIEGNLIWNTNDSAIQSAADSIIRNNVVLGSPIALQPHQANSPSNQEVVHNTVVVNVNGSGIDVRGVRGFVLIANNAINSQAGTAIRLISGSTNLVTLTGNVGSDGISGSAAGYTEGNGIGVDFVNGYFGGAPPIDVFPGEGSALIAGGSGLHVTVYDINDKLRQGVPDVGAYLFQAGGIPGWALTTAFK